MASEENVPAVKGTSATGETMEVEQVAEKPVSKDYSIASSDKGASPKAKRRRLKEAVAKEENKE